MERKLSIREIRQKLWQIKILSPSQREEILKEFEKYKGGGGVSEFEIRKVIRKFIADKSDNISPEEARALYRLIE